RDYSLHICLTHDILYTWASISSAYPIFAQQIMKIPRGNWAYCCANCHLASKPVDIEFPQLKQVLANGGYEITIVDASNERQVIDIIPRGLELLVSEGESIKLDQPLTSNPNVGGFGQGDAEIVLQDPLRVQGLLFFLGSVVLAQIFWFLKRNSLRRFNYPK
ncbi:hypothetical protein HID58_096105, partial [Brassica napus]